jgi:lipopolysaccharide export system protein LptA
MTDRFPSAARRAALAAAIIAAGLLGTAPQLSAQLFKGHNSNAPVNYSADRIELQDKDNRVVLSGAVDVTQDKMELRAARVTVNYTNNGSLKIQQMIANGNVDVTQQTNQGTDHAHGDVAVYDLIQRIITMSGNVTLNRANGDTLKGGRAVIDLAKGVSSIDGRPAGGAGSGKGSRVSGTFTVAKGK